MFFIRIMLLTVMLSLSTVTVSAGFSVYADYDYSNFRYFSEGVQQIDGGLVGSSTTCQGDINTVRVGANIGPAGKAYLFGFDFSHGQGSTPGVSVVGSTSQEFSATTVLDNARLYAAYLLHAKGDGQLRFGYGYEQITTTYSGAYPRQSTFNYIFAEIKDDLLRLGNSSAQLEVTGRFNFYSKAANYSAYYNETVYFDNLNNSFGVAVALPLNYGFNDTVTFTVKPWYSYNKRGLGTTTVFEQQGEAFCLAPATFQQYGMSAGASIKF